MAALLLGLLLVQALLPLAVLAFLLVALPAFPLLLGFLPLRQALLLLQEFLLLALLLHTNRHRSADCLHTRRKSAHSWR